MAEAEARQDSGNPGQWMVSIGFTADGSRKFEQLTDANVKRRLAIVLDGTVESAPVIQERIAGGKAVISMGAASPEAGERNARQLELVLRSGALPSRVVLVSEEVIRGG